MTQLVGHLREGLGDSRAEGPLPIGNAPRHGHFQSLRARAEKRGSGGVGGRQYTTGQEHLTRETSAEDPKDFLAHIGLEAIEGQDTTPLRLRQAPQPCRGLEGESDQFVIALQEMGDRPGRDSHTTRDQRLRDSWHTVVGGRALRANAGEAIEATLVLGQGQAPC